MLRVGRWCQEAPPELLSPGLWGDEGVGGGVQSRLPHGRAVPHPGLLWQLRPSDVEVELLAHTQDVVSRELPAETGLHTGWVQNGGLFIASNKQRLDEYKRLMSVGNGPPGVTPEDVAFISWGPPGFHTADKNQAKCWQNEIQLSIFARSDSSSIIFGVARAA